MSGKPEHRTPPIPCIVEWRHFDSTGSTNQDALHWLAKDAPDQSLISADHQSHGRGRANRSWVTNMDAGLAFSLLIRPKPAEILVINRFTALAALALVHWIFREYRLRAEIKWPNDVLIHDKKVAGILVETEWAHDHPMGLVIGVGINVSPASVPKNIVLRHPASCLADEIGCPVDRDLLMWGVLQEMCVLRKRLKSHGVIRAWNRHLAYKHKVVNLHHLDERIEPVEIIRVNSTGNLVVEGRQGKRFEIYAGELGLF